MKVPRPIVIVAGRIVLELLERPEPLSTPSEHSAQRPTQIFPSLRVCAVGCEIIPVAPYWVDVARDSEMVSNDKDSNKHRRQKKRSINLNEPLLELTNQPLVSLRNDKINKSFTPAPGNHSDTEHSVRQKYEYFCIHPRSTSF